MHKIATPQQLQSELRQIMSTVQEGCSRQRIAAELLTLANEVGSRVRTAGDIVAPIVNLNGSDPARLTEDLYKAYKALRGASSALAECMPHGRDYQSNPPQDYPLARAQHTARLDAVRGIMEDLLAVSEAIDRQKRDRDRQRSSR